MKNQITIINKVLADQYKIVEVENIGDLLTIGALQPIEKNMHSDLEFILEKKIEVKIIKPEDFHKEYDKHYHTKNDVPNLKNTESISLNNQDDFTPDTSDYNNFSAIKPINILLEQALYEKASDIHFESRTNSLVVRFRIDGELRDWQVLPNKYSKPIISRLKVMCDMDITETRLPQDGAIHIIFQSRTIDIRVSTIPGFHGEKVVLRLLDKKASFLEINKVGFLDWQLNDIINVISNKTGMVLVTGPTGSGKSTTLYSILQHLKTNAVNILTVEDPIEYDIDGITQTLMRSEINYTFSNALRSFLRQDPDIIMVGEMRDQETCEIAVRAALTGHLVLSTLHTNDAVSTVYRLIDMGIKPFLITSSVNAIISQRLVRKLCKLCKYEKPPNNDMLNKIGVKLPGNFYAAKGCSECYQGLKGRTITSEVLILNDPIKRNIQNNISPQELRELVYEQGFKPMQYSICEKMNMGEIGENSIKDLLI